MCVYVIEDTRRCKASLVMDRISRKANQGHCIFSCCGSLFKIGCVSIEEEKRSAPTPAIWNQRADKSNIDILRWLFHFIGNVTWYINFRGSFLVQAKLPSLSLVLHKRVVEAFEYKRQSTKVFFDKKTLVVTGITS